MEIGQIILIIIGTLIVVIGLVALVLPLVPGPLLIFTGLVLAAWAENFEYAGAGTIVILAVLMILAHALDLVAGGLGAKRFGASPRAGVGAVIGAVAGIFFGFPGIIIGPFIGAVIGQLTVKSDIQAAGKAGIGAWIGLVFGTALKVALGFSMIGIFILSRFL